MELVIAFILGVSVLFYLARDETLLERAKREMRTK